MHRRSPRCLTMPEGEDLEVEILVRPQRCWVRPVARVEGPTHHGWDLWSQLQPPGRCADASPAQGSMVKSHRGGALVFSAGSTTMSSDQLGVTWTIFGGRNFARGSPTWGWSIPSMNGLWMINDAFLLVRMVKKWFNNGSRWYSIACWEQSTKFLYGQQHLLVYIYTWIYAGMGHIQPSTSRGQANVPRKFPNLGFFGMWPWTEGVHIFSQNHLIYLHYLPQLVI